MTEETDKDAPPMDGRPDWCEVGHEVFIAIMALQGGEFATTWPTYTPPGYPHWRRRYWTLGGRGMENNTLGHTLGIMETSQLTRKSHFFCPRVSGNPGGWQWMP